MICFNKDTLIATPKGDVPIGELRAGDEVITRDNGVQRISSVSKKSMTGRELFNAPHLRPILIQEGALGDNLPEVDMQVSPNHRIAVGRDQSSLDLKGDGSLVAAKHLVNHKNIVQIDCFRADFFQIQFNKHEIIMVDGSWNECFNPGDYSMKALGNSQRNEILEMFPNLQRSDRSRVHASASNSVSFQKLTKRFGFR